MTRVRSGLTGNGARTASEVSGPCSAKVYRPSGYPSKCSEYFAIALSSLPRAPPVHLFRDTVNREWQRRIRATIPRSTTRNCFIRLLVNSRCPSLRFQRTSPRKSAYPDAFSRHTKSGARFTCWLSPDPKTLVSCLLTTHADHAVWFRLCSPSLAASCPLQKAEPLATLTSPSCPHFGSIPFKHLA